MAKIKPEEVTECKNLINIALFFQLHPRPAPREQRARRGADGGAHRHPHLPPARRLQLQEDQESAVQNQVRGDSLRKIACIS